MAPARASTLGLIAVALAITSLVVSALLRVYLLNQTEQELRVYAASLSSIDPAELSAAGPQLPTGFTARIIDLRTGSVSSLGEAVTEQDRADDPEPVGVRPRGSRGASPSGSARPAATREWLALAQLNEPRSEIYVARPPPAARSTAPSTSSCCYAAGDRRHHPHRHGRARLVPHPPDLPAR